MENIIQNLKEFIWDIIGYLIPGFLLIICGNFFLMPDIGITKDYLFDWNYFGAYLIVVLSYCLGYVVYGITMFKISFQDSLIDFVCSFKVLEFFSSRKSDAWKESFKKSGTFENAKNFLAVNGIENIDSFEVNEIRNVLMSKDPSMDQKVYTFMFRSSLFDHISTILILTVFTAVFQCILSFFGLFFMKFDFPYLVIYVIFIFLIPMLGDQKRKFFSISQRIPFSNLK
jgi:hypothetical protein